MHGKLGGGGMRRYRAAGSMPAGVALPPGADRGPTGELLGRKRPGWDGDTGFAPAAKSGRPVRPPV